MLIRLTASPVSRRNLLLSRPVSYTHLDVYKRQLQSCFAVHSEFMHTYKQITDPKRKFKLKCIFYSLQQFFRNCIEKSHRN